MSAATPALRYLDRRAIAHTVHEYRHDPTVTAYGDEAASVLGVDPARIFKTIVCTTGSRLVVAVVPVGCEVDLRALAAEVGAKRVDTATAAEAERATGYVIGGISPLGQKRALPAVVDESALSWGSVFVSAGRRGLEVELAPADLVAATSASVAAVARPR